MTWVYGLPKAKLTEWAKHRGIDQSGDLDTLRARVVAHLRAMNQDGTAGDVSINIDPPTDGATTLAVPLLSFSPRPGDQQPVEVAAPADTYHIMERVRRWGGYYDGGKGAEDFLDHLDELRDSY